jgi:GNAT superfamily N-acetyltransferase
MQLVTFDISTRPALPEDAHLVHRLYTETPDYFDIISIPLPTLDEVRYDLELARHDSRRHTELLICEGIAGIADIHGRNIVGYLDYKLEYPQAGDAMVNLLLIWGNLQSKGLGQSAVKELESRLKGQAKRVLVSIYGQNPRAERFWKALGYSFAIDAKPVLDWYAKSLS